MFRTWLDTVKETEERNIYLHLYYVSRHFKSTKMSVSNLHLEMTSLLIHLLKSEQLGLWLDKKAFISLPWISIALNRSAFFINSYNHVHGDLHYKMLWMYPLVIKCTVVVETLAFLIYLFFFASFESHKQLGVINISCTAMKISSIGFYDLDQNGWIKAPSVT